MLLLLTFHEALTIFRPIILKSLYHIDFIFLGTTPKLNTTYQTGFKICLSGFNTENIINLRFKQSSGRIAWRMDQPNGHNTETNKGRTCI